MSDRAIQLAFDGEISSSTKVETGIPQGSPASPILFLIYIRFLFKEANNIKIRIPSYIDDIAMLAISDTLEENCLILQDLADKLIQWGKENRIEFDKEKTELIHFYKDKEDKPDLSIKLSNSLTIEPKSEVKWLGIWFDRKLSFKTHVEKAIAKANRVFHQISRLANCSRGLSYQAMRQLYLACITSIADYGVPIWWRGQVNLLDRFKKLQNSMLRKVLGAFKTSPIGAMEIEASILPVRIRFQKICQNYAFRTLSIDLEHPIRKRAPESFPFSGNSELEEPNWDIYLDWNQTDLLGKKDYPTQLYRVLNSIASSIPTLNIEKPEFKRTPPWQDSSERQNSSKSKSKEPLTRQSQQSSQRTLSLNSIKGRLKQNIKEEWVKYWNKEKKGRHYLQFNPDISLKTTKTITDRRTWTAYIQLKLGHGFFRSYLVRLPQYDSNRCIGVCRGIQSPSHLYLSCYHYREEQKELQRKLKELYPKVERISLKEIYKEKSKEIVYNYLRTTRIATREWLLGLEEEEEQEEGIE
jgi:hypothetical protein